MDEKRKAMTDERTEPQAGRRASEAEPPFDLEGDFATEHALPSSDPRHAPGKARRGGFPRLRRRART